MRLPLLSLAAATCLLAADLAAQQTVSATARNRYEFNAGSLGDLNGGMHMGASNSGLSLEADRDGVGVSAVGFTQGFLGLNDHTWARDGSSTVGVWVRTADALNGETYVMDFRTPGDNGNHVLLIDVALGEAMIFSDGVYGRFDVDLPRDRWFHLAYVVDEAAGEYRVYLDGVRQRSLDPSNGNFRAVTSASTQLRIGSDATGRQGGSKFRGSLDDVTFFDRALTDTEAARLAAEGPTRLLHHFTLDRAAVDRLGGGALSLPSVNGSPPWVAGRNASTTALLINRNSASLRRALYDYRGASTTAMWLRFGAGNANLEQYVFDANVNGVASYVFATLDRPRNQIRFGYDGGTVDEFPYAVTDDAWHHFAFVVDTAARRNRVFVDGTELARSSTGAFVAPAGAGATQYAFGDEARRRSDLALRGVDIDDIYVYTGAITAAEARVLAEVETPDTQAPKAPTDLTVADLTTTSATLTWTAATDDVGVAGYEVAYSPGGAPTTVTATTAALAGLTPATAYTVTVVAVDAVGNRSLAATTTFATATPADTQAPTAPTDLAATAVTPEAISVAWAASTDDVGVSGYEVFLDGVSVATVAATAYDFTALTAATDYTVGVRALDAAGNASATAELAVRTAAASALHDLHRAGVRVFPNPATAGTLYVRGAGGGEARILDALGRALLRVRLDAERVDVTGLAPGAYVLMVYDAGGVPLGSTTFVR